VVELIEGLDAGRVRANLTRLSETIEAARLASPHGAPEPVEILAAAKYVPDAALPLLAEAGVRLLGENRAQDLERKTNAYGDLFTWDFIGQLQSRRVRAIVPRVRMIHSLASESAREQLALHHRPGLEVLVQVNIAREDGKAGLAPEQLDDFLARCEFPVAGLMTMPPLAADPEASRPWCAALRELAAERGLRRLSMGTSQDHVVAVEEGATIVRIGTSLYD
jgi:uncharacterized pyridoxal phosphate-containing UPF0001 family protein